MAIVVVPSRCSTGNPPPDVLLWLPVLLMFFSSLSSIIILCRRGVQASDRGIERREYSSSRRSQRSLKSGKDETYQSQLLVAMEAVFG